MSATVKQPVGQKRLTNIAVVRMKKGGKRFEIACYKNKVLSWRSGVEKDIDEVLQTHAVFSNVGKGSMAKAKELKDAFGTDDEDAICRLILDKGELQISDKERESNVSSQFRDIASIVMEKTINPQTERPYTMSMIEKFIRDVHFSVDPHKSSKQQALELIHKLRVKFPIARARMELRLSVPSFEKETLKNRISVWGATSVAEIASTDHFSVVCQVDPGFYRECDSLMHELKGRLEVVSLSVQREGDARLDAFDTSPNVEKGSNVTLDPLSGREMDNVTPPNGENHTSMIEQKFRQLSTNVSMVGADFEQGPIVVGETSRKVISEGGKQHRCNTCTVTLADVKLYRDHFKSDWHKYNLKRKLKNLPPVSEDEWVADRDILAEADNGLDDF